MTSRSSGTLESDSRTGDVVSSSLYAGTTTEIRIGNTSLQWEVAMKMKITMCSKSNLKNRPYYLQERTKIKIATALGLPYLNSTVSQRYNQLFFREVESADLPRVVQFLYDLPLACRPEANHPFVNLAVFASYGYPVPITRDC